MTAASPPLLLRRLSRGQLLAFDRVLAAAVALLGWFAAAAEVPPPARGVWLEPRWVSVLAALLLAAPVAFRRHRPVGAACFALGVATAVLASGVIPDFAGIAPMVVLCLVLYTVGTDVPRRRSVPVVIVSVVVAMALFAAVSGQPFQAFLMAWVLGACWTVGRAARERRAYAARSAEQATELAVGEERLRIARELHDIVTHSMSLIAVKATIADHLADAQPQAMREALRVIATTSRDTLGELRRALGVLRTEGTLVPAPSLADLEDLAAAARSTGLLVDLDVRGGDAAPSDVGLTVFRLVQESLTNVVKHARAARCQVEVTVGGGDIRLRVVDDGSGAGAAGASAGQGLIGMRERAAVFGGELTAGPAPGGGWVVATTLRWAP